MHYNWALGKIIITVFQFSNGITKLVDASKCQYPSMRHRIDARFCSPRSNRFHRIVGKCIVAVEHQCVVARYNCPSRVDRCRFPPIVVVAKPSDRKICLDLPASQECRGVVGRTVIYHNPFEIACLLPIQAVINSVQDMRPVISDCQNGNRKIRHSYVFS